VCLTLPVAAVGGEVDSVQTYAEIASADGSGISVKRSLRIQALEGQKAVDGVYRQLQREKNQQYVLNTRIGQLLKKVEYMDRKKNAAEESLATTKLALAEATKHVPICTLVDCLCSERQR